MLELWHNYLNKHLMGWLGFALLSALFVSIASIIEKRTLVREHAMEYSAVVSTMIAILSLPFFFLTDYSSLNLKVVLFIYGLSIIGAIGGLLLVRAIRHMEISLSSPLMVLSPGITAVLALVFLNEKLSLLQWLGMVVLIVGAYFLQKKPREKLLNKEKVFRKGNYIGVLLLGLLLYGISSIMDRVVLSRYVDVYTYMALVNFFLAINYIVMLAIYHDGFKGLKHGFKASGWPMLVIAALFVASRYFQAYSVSLAYVGLAIAIKRMSVIFTALIGGVLFHEDHLWRKMGATAVMIAGALLIVWRY